MKTFTDYIAETQQWMTHPAAGDDFAIELEDGTLLETWIMDIEQDAMLLDATSEILESLESWYEVTDQINEDLADEDLDVVLEGYYGGLNTGESAMDEAEYHGHQVPLGKPMRGDVKKFKVYVRDPKTGNIKKVNFGHGGKSARRMGQKTMRIKKSNPARRRSFRARHHCENPGPRTKARYWSCRAW
jgi:hypothetical protein